MINTDFKKYNIDNYTPEEVRGTGAMLSEVQLRLMVAVQIFRITLGRRVGLLHNGMTTGQHKAPEHALGLAVDCFLYPADGFIDTSSIFKAALSSGFKGIGIYWNGVQYSFHLDLRSEYGFWGGYKDVTKGVKEWQYTSLLTEMSESLLF